MSKVTKKRMVSRKQHSGKSKVRNRSKSLSKKKTANKTKPKNHAAAIKNADKQPLNTNASPVTKTQKRKRGNPWPKGVSGNPKGRPKDGHTKLDNLLRGLREAETEENKNLLKHFFKEAFQDTTILIAAMKKLYPDLKSIEQVTLAADSMTEKEAADIRKEMAKRFRTK